MNTLLPLLDTHQHLLMTDRWPYSWTEGLPPLKDRAFQYSDYLAEAEGCGIGGTLFMESTPDHDHWKEETRIALEMARDPETLIRGVIANARPEADDFAAWVESIRSPHLKGIRRILHVEPDTLSAQPTFIRSVQHLGTIGLPFDLCVLARQLPVATALVDACEGTRFILDHCGVPDIAGDSMEPWKEHIRELAKRPHVACKISGVVAYCPPGTATLDTLRPYLDHCLECFGWDRIVWGSDWPVCRLSGTLAHWVDLTRSWMAAEAPENQARLFSKNAETLYGVSL